MIPPNFMPLCPKLSQAGMTGCYGRRIVPLWEGIDLVARAFLPSRDDAREIGHSRAPVPQRPKLSQAGTMRNVLVWEGLSILARVFLPSRDDGRAQRPCLGEIRPRKRANDLNSAQRPGLGENPARKIPALESRREWQRFYLRLCRVPCGRSRAVLSQAETLCMIPPNLTLPCLKLSQAGTMCSVPDATSLLGRS